MAVYNRMAAALFEANVKLDQNGVEFEQSRMVIYWTRDGH